MTTLVAHPISPRVEQKPKRDWTYNKVLSSERETRSIQLYFQEKAADKWFSENLLSPIFGKKATLRIEESNL